MVKIGLSDDPKAAMAAHREKARMSAAKSRKSRAANGADVGAPEKAGVKGGEDSPEPGTVEQELDQMIRAYEALSNEARGLFLKWLAGKDGKDALPRDLPVTREAMSHSPAQAARETA